VFPGPPLGPAYRFAGAILSLCGAAVGVARFRVGWKPQFLEVPLPALCTSFTETRWFTSITRNTAGEVATLLVLGGLTLAALGREPQEAPWHAEARAKALVVAVAIDTLLVAVTSLTVFGLAFVAVLVGQMFATLLLYHAAFRWLVWRHGRQRPSGELPDA
jgi:hypothetical protein